MMTVQSPAGVFVEQLFSKLQNQGRGDDWSAGQLANAIVRVMAGPLPPAPPPMDAVYNIDKVDNTTMIHEMLRRGYAVMKVPEGGKPDLVKD